MYSESNYSMCKEKGKFIEYVNYTANYNNFMVIHIKYTQRAYIHLY